MEVIDRPVMRIWITEVDIDEHDGTRVGTSPSPLREGSDGNMSPVADCVFNLGAHPVLRSTQRPSLTACVCDRRLDRIGVLIALARKDHSVWLLSG